MVVSGPEANQVRRVELILQQVDALPTLSPVAIRLLDLTSAENTEVKDVIRLVSSDPALSSKVLKLCRCHPRGRTATVNTVERAVVLLGFEAVRSAVLSVQVIELFDDLPSIGGEVREQPIFDRRLFWEHSLAVGVASELLAETGTLRAEVDRGEAYISGLLHDLEMTQDQYLLLLCGKQIEYFPYLPAELLDLQGPVRIDRPGVLEDARQRALIVV